jgi:uncharacterized protein
MKPINLTLQQARNVQLAALGLLTPPKKLARKTDVLKAIRAMHVLQIDTISVVARSPYLVLWSRLGEYHPPWLDELHAEGAFFEYWAHAACFIPTEDYPLYRYNMRELALTGSKRTAERLRTHSAELKKMLAHVRTHGEVRTLDFDRPDGAKGNGWWDWKPEKVFLETLFTAGELMVSRREKFHRIYDLRERVLPEAFLRDDNALSREQVERAWTLKAIHALGIATPRWIGDYFRHAGRVPSPHPEAFVETGELVPVKIEGLAATAYATQKNLALLRQAARDELAPTHTTLLSPFDPLVWDRERALALFNFDYRIECYTPEAKRKYGYFTLPILYRGAIIGRVDAKAHRREGVFEVVCLTLEPGTKANQALIAEVARAISDCARWHETPHVKITKTEPKAFAAALKSAIKSLVNAAV